MIQTPLFLLMTRLCSDKYDAFIISTYDSSLSTNTYNLCPQSRLIHNGSWGTLAWGPPLPWAVTEQQPLPIAVLNPPPADEADGFQD